MRHVPRLIGGQVGLGDLAATLAEVYGRRTAIEGAARTWTYEALAHEVEQRAALHRAAGRAGQTVLLRWPNGVELLVELLSLARAGAVVAPVKARAHDDEVQAIADVVGATDQVIGEGLASVRLGAGAAPRSGTAVMLCTSGTTGRPKAAELTARGLLGALGWLTLLPVGRTAGWRAGRDAVLSALPLAHVMGLATALGTLVAGVPWVHRARFDAAEVLDLLEQRAPNVFVGVPTMFADLEQAGAAERDLRSVQLWISAADAMPADRARRFQLRGAAVRVAGQAVGRAVFVDVYGMVELSGPAGVRVLPPWPVPGAVPYRIRPGLRVRAVDGEGRALSWLRRGELQFRGAGVMRGYRGAEAQDWLATGDVGHVLPGGWFVASGRHRDRVKVGGFSVFPAELEAILDGGPGAREVAVVGVPDARLGERLVALVVAEEGFDAEAWLTWARSQLSGYRRPSAVVVVDALPRGPNGKLDRRAATALAGLGGSGDGGS